MDHPWTYLSCSSLPSRPSPLSRHTLCSLQTKSTAPRSSTARTSAPTRSVVPRATYSPNNTHALRSTAPLANGLAGVTKHVGFALLLRLPGSAPVEVKAAASCSMCQTSVRVKHPTVQWPSSFMGMAGTTVLVSDRAACGITIL